MSVTSIENFYIGYFGRAADPAGLNYWLTQEAAGVSDVTIAAAFAASPEALALYPALGTPILLQQSTAAQLNFLNAVYQNMFGHATDTAGATYWEGMLTAGVNPGVVISQIISGALGADAVALSSKNGVATSYTNAVLTAVPAVTYSKNDVNQSRTILSGVTNASTAAATGPAISAAIAFDQSGNTGVVGATLTLGTGGQVFSPTQTGGLQTTGGNTIRGVSVSSSYLSTSDSISGAGDFNTINTVLADDDGNVIAPVPGGMQAVNLGPTGAAQTFSRASSTGVQTLSVAGGIFSVASDGEATGVTLTVTGFSTATAMDFSTATAMGMPNNASNLGATTPDDNLFVSFTGLSATATNTASLVLADNGNAAEGGRGFDSSFSSSTGVGVNTLNVSSTGKANYVTIGDIDQALTSIVITGSASLTMLENDTSVTTINGSAATGSLAITTLSRKATITGGSGNDTLNASAATNAVTMTEGAGTDTMVLNGHNAANMVNAGTGIDTVQFMAIGGWFDFIAAADTTSNATLTGDLNLLNNHTAGNIKIDLHGLSSRNLDTTINATSVANALAAATSLLAALNAVTALIVNRGAADATVVGPIDCDNEYVWQGPVRDAWFLESTDIDHGHDGLISPQRALEVFLGYPITTCAQADSAKRRRAFEYAVCDGFYYQTSNVCSDATNGGAVETTHARAGGL